MGHVLLRPSSPATINILSIKYISLSAISFVNRELKSSLLGCISRMQISVYCSQMDALRVGNFRRVRVMILYTVHFIIHFRSRGMWCILSMVYVIFSATFNFENKFMTDLMAFLSNTWCCFTKNPSILDTAKLGSLQVFRQLIPLRKLLSIHYNFCSIWTAEVEDSTNRSLEDFEWDLWPLLFELFRKD